MVDLTHNDHFQTNKGSILFSMLMEATPGALCVMIIFTTRLMLITIIQHVNGVALCVMIIFTTRLIYDDYFQTNER